MPENVGRVMVGVPIQGLWGYGSDGGGLFIGSVVEPEPLRAQPFFGWSSTFLSAQAPT